MRLVFLAIIPAEPLLSDLRERMEYYSELLHSEKALHLPPHLTVVAPFLTDRIDALVDGLRKECSSIPHFNIELENLKTFSDRVLFMEIKWSGLHDLHNQVIDVCALFREHRWKSNNYTRHLSKRQKDLEALYGDPKVKEFYIPHFTLAKSDLDKKALQELLANKSEEQLRTWPVQSLCVMVRGNDKWEVYAEVALQ